MIGKTFGFVFNIWSIQVMKPLRSAERMPLAFKVMMRMEITQLAIDLWKTYYTQFFNKYVARLWAM